MLKSKFVVAASLVLVATGAFADTSNYVVIGERGIVFSESESAPRDRAVVLAELREAQRLGLVSIGEGNMPIATPEQERLIAQAGHDAAEQFASSGDVEG